MMAEDLSGDSQMRIAPQVVVEMPPHQQRVVQEKHGLDDKRAALKAFMRGATFHALPEDERKRMDRQLRAMTTYSVVLGERIDAFTP
jgi:hypothetical protein